MSKFTAKIKAELDVSKVNDQISKIEKSKITLTNVDINTTGLAQKIQQALKNQNFKLVVNDVDMGNVAKQAAQVGKNAGQQMANEINKSLGSIKINKTSGFDNINEAFDSLTNKLNLKSKDIDAFKKSIAGSMVEIDTFTKSVRESGMSDAKTYTFDIKGVDEFGKNVHLVRTYRDQLDEDGKAIAGSIEFLNSSVSQTTSNSAAIKEQNQAYRNLISTISEITKVQKELDTIEITGKGSEERVNQLKNRLAELVTKEKEYKDIASQDGGIVAQEERVTNAYSKQKAALEDNILKQKELKATQQELLLNKIPSAQNSFEKWCATNTKAAEVYEQELKELRAEYNALFSNAKSGKDVTKELDAVNTKFKQIQTQAVVEGNMGLTTWDRLKQQVSKYSNYFSVATLTFKGVQELKKMYNNVKDIDSAMTELKKVTDETDEAYSKFLSSATSRSKDLGTSIDGMVSSTADFARLGFSLEESQSLAEVANIYANVGDDVSSVESATQSIVSTMKAFGIEAKDAISIVDKFNEVGNNFAISSGGIGEAMMRSAASFKAANNTIDESIALITATNEIVQDPEKVGTVWNTVALRIRGAKTDLEEAGLII